MTSELSRQQFVKLSPAERLEVLANRLRGEARRRQERKKAPHELYKHAIQRARDRRARLESERADWARLVAECSGRITKIAHCMGRDIETAKYAIWDLGLWPAMVAARRDKP